MIIVNYYWLFRCFYKKFTSCVPVSVLNCLYSNHAMPTVFQDARCWHVRICCRLILFFYEYELWNNILICKMANNCYFLSMSHRVKIISPSMQYTELIGDHIPMQKFAKRSMRDSLFHVVQTSKHHSCINCKQRINCKHDRPVGVGIDFGQFLLFVFNGILFYDNKIKMNTR